MTILGLLNEDDLEIVLSKNEKEITKDYDDINKLNLNVEKGIITFLVFNEISKEKLNLLRRFSFFNVLIK